MSTTPKTIINANLSSLNTVATNIETACDTYLTNNYIGTAVSVNIHSYLSGLTQTQVFVVFELVKLKYPKWRLELYNETANTNRYFIRFNASDFT